MTYNQFLEGNVSVHGTHRFVPYFSFLNFIKLYLRVFLIEFIHCLFIERENVDVLVQTKTSKYTHGKRIVITQSQ